MKRQLLASIVTASSISVQTITAFSPRFLSTTAIATHPTNSNYIARGSSRSNSNNQYKIQSRQTRFAPVSSHTGVAKPPIHRLYSETTNNPAIHSTRGISGVQRNNSGTNDPDNTTQQQQQRSDMSTTTATETSADTAPVVLNTGILQKISPSEVSLEIKDPVDPTALKQAKAILEELVVGNTDGGRVNPSKLLEVATRLGDLPEGSTIDDLIVSKSDCKAAYEGLAADQRRALDNMHHRIKTFAELQRASVTNTETDIPGGKAGHTVSPCRGRFSQQRLHRLSSSSFVNGTERIDSSPIFVFTVVVVVFLYPFGS